MAKKENFWNNTWIGYAAKSLITATFIVVALGLVALFLLRIYTRHGESETVPQLKGLNLEEAATLLARHNLQYEIIDSVYVRGKKLGAVIEQNPAARTVVKPNRHIYLIINSKSVRKITLPDLRDISLRQAEAMAQSLGINVAKVEYAPSEYKDLVLDVKFNGQPLLPGSKIPEGSAITLIAGSGTGQLVDGVAPNVTGLDLTTATGVLASTSYLLGGVIYDVPPAGDDAEYTVFNQNPAAGTPITPGTVIDVWLSKNPVQAKEEFVQPTQPQHRTEKEKTKDIEEFF